MITTSQRNPRARLSGIDELAESLRVYGLLQPVIVRPWRKGYELVAGNRRLAAARQLGWEAIQAIVRPAAADQAYVLTLVENLQREDLSPREESAALEALVREHSWSTHQVAAAIHRSQAYVSKRLRVFEDAMLAPVVMAKKLTVSAAEELLALPEQDRYSVLSAAVDGAWDLAQIRDAVRQARLGRRARHGVRRAPGLAGRIHALRVELRALAADDLQEVDRRELRLLFKELSMLGRARPGAARVFPALPSHRS